MKVSPILVFALGDQGMTFARALKSAFDAKFGVVAALMDGICLDRDGNLVRLREGQGSAVQLAKDLRADLKPGVFAANRLALVRGLRVSASQVERELADLFTSATETQVVSSFTFAAIPTIFICAPSGDAVGSAAFMPFLKTLHTALDERFRQALDRHLIVLLPGIFRETATDDLANARSYEFMRELESILERPAVVTGMVKTPPVTMTWVLGNQTENGYTIQDYVELASNSVELIAYLSWNLIDLQYAMPALNNTILGKRASYSSFGCVRLVYPTDSVKTASIGRAESQLLEGAYPDILLQESLAFNKTELFQNVRKFVKDAGIDEIADELEVSTDGRQVSVVVQPSIARGFDTQADTYISNFEGALRQSTTSSFGEAEADIARKGDAVLDRLKDATVRFCQQRINEPGKGMKYAMAFLHALLQKDRVPYAREELPQESLTLADVREELRAKFDQAFGIQEGTRRRLVELRRIIVEKDTLLRNLEARRSQAVKSSLTAEAEELERQSKGLRSEKESLEKQYADLYKAVADANFKVDDPSKRREVLDSAVKTALENIETCKARVRDLHARYLQVKDQAQRMRSAMVAGSVAAALFYGLVYILCWGTGALQRFATHVAGAWFFLPAVAIVDFLIGSYRAYRRTEQERVEVGRQKVEAMSSLVSAGNRYLEEKLSYARTSASLSVLRELWMDIELRYIPTLDAAMKFVKDRYTQAYQAMSSIRESDTFLEKYIIGRRDLEAFFLDAQDRLSVEFSGFLTDHLPSMIWDDLREQDQDQDREPSWPAHVQEFCARVFEGLWGKSIQELLRTGDLVPRELFLDKFIRFQHDLDIFVNVEQIPSTSPTRLKFVGLKDAQNSQIAELLAKSDEGYSVFPTLDERAMLGVIVQSGIPAFGISSCAAGFRAASQYSPADLAANVDLRREDLYPPGYVTDINADREFWLWCLAEAFGLSYRHGPEAGPDQPEGDVLRQLVASARLPFDEFRITLREQPDLRSFLESELEKRMKAPDAADSLRRYLAGNPPEREEAVVHRALDIILASAETAEIRPSVSEPAPTDSLKPVDAS